MESTINEMLLHAIEVINESDDLRKKNANDNRGADIKKIYESYLSQFGPMVVNLEMRNSVAVYRQDKENSEGSRDTILKVIFALIKRFDSQAFTQANYNEWVKYLLTNDINYTQETLILDASIALKRAIRTFKLVK